MAQSQIAKGALISYIAIFINIIITFFYTPWMIRKIGVSDYGLYNLVATFLTYFIIDFGLSGTTTRFISKYKAEGKIEKVENLLGIITKVYLAIDFVIFLVIAICYPFITDIFKGLTLDELGKLKILYLIAGLFSVLNFIWMPLSGAMMAFEYFVPNKLLDLLQRVGSVCLIVLTLYLDGGVYELVFITGASGFIVSLIRFYIFKKKSKIKVNWGYFNQIEMRSLLSFSGWVFLIGVAQRFRLTMIPSVLGVLSNTMQISIFSIGMALEGTIYTLSSALNGLFLPKVTRMLNTDADRSEVLKLMIRVGRIQLFIMSIIILGFVIVGETFIRLWVGDDFKDSYIVVICLISTNLISMTQQIAGDVVYAENKVRYTSTLTFVSSGVSLIISVLLAKSYGAIGCGVAFALAMGVNLVLINIFYSRTLKLNIRCFFYECHFKIMPPLIIVTTVFLIAKKYFVIDSWMAIICYATIFTFSSLLVSYFIMNDDEKHILRFLK